MVNKFEKKKISRIKNIFAIVTLVRSLEHTLILPFPMTEILDLFPKLTSPLID